MPLCTRGEVVAVSALPRLFLSLLAIVGAAAPSRAAETELTVFAAASLTEALTEIGASFEAGSGTKVAFNFGASSALARQIDAGAPADLFVSADEAKVDALVKRGRIDQATRRELLSNRLVIVVATEGGAAVVAPADLASSKVRVLALAEPQTVPAGIYAKEYLQKTGLWEKVIDKVVPTENVRAALAAVESGNADAAIVYATDAGISRRVRVAVEVPAREAPRIVYVAAVPTEARSPVDARTLLDFLGSESASAVFRRFGFVVLAPAS
jgi:molybdate transport system substrate-binding protein